MKKLSDEFIKFIYEPSKLVLSFAIILSLLSSLTTLPWSKLRCFINERTNNECVQARSEANTSLILFLLFLLCTSSLIERYEKFQNIEKKLGDIKGNLEGLNSLFNGLSDSVRNIEEKKLGDIKGNLEGLNSLFNGLSDSVRNIDFKKQITQIKGSEEWYETAHNLIIQGNTFVYDASLSSRIWSDRSKKKDFFEARKRAFKDKNIETKYLIALKTYFEKEQFEKFIKDMNDNGSECELEAYKEKLLGDIDRLSHIKEMLEITEQHFSAAFIPDIKLDHPLLSFLVIGGKKGKKILLGFYLSEFQASNPNKDVILLIDNKDVANMFQEYFVFLWDKAATKFAHDSAKLKDLIERLNEQKKELTEMLN